MVLMQRKPRSGTTENLGRRRWPGSYVFSIALLVGAWFGCQAGAQDGVNQSPAVGARTTVVIFADRPVEDAEWKALFAALRTTATEEKVEGIGETVEIVRGDAISHGLLVEDSIVVFLHGNCGLEPLPRRTAYSVPLGWVTRQNGRIAPFIHVDCTQIGQVLGAQAQGLNKEERDRMMAGALARVMLHEWIHVARQSAEHGRAGITKARFGVADLTGETEPRAAGR